MSKLWSPTTTTGAQQAEEPLSSPSGSNAAPRRRESVSLAEQYAARQRNPGRRVAQIVRLKPEFVDRYKQVHAAVWPEVLQQIKVCNIQDCE